ncbi:DUF6159 family protein [Methanofollis fontis]|nr:DUF6159 family protein [Methanofollis fontis]
MAGTFGRSIALIKTSLSVLKQDRELLLFPVLSAIATIILVASFIVPIFVSGLLMQAASSWVLQVVLLAIFYFITFSVAIFFNTGIIACADIRLRGGDPTVRDGLSVAWANIGRILSWALVAATVGLVLRLAAERSGLLGKIAIAIVGGVWSLATLFVIPVMVFEQKGVADAIGESWRLFKGTWGENVIGNGGLGLLVLPGILLFVLAFASLVLGNIVLTAGLFVLAIIGTAVLGVVYGSLHGIFVTALYRYAKDGTVSPAFGDDLVRNAFVAKR